jgi:hypothetical protein
VKEPQGWRVLREWNQTAHIRNRADVVTHKSDWESLIADMLVELNGFFVSGELKPARIGDIVADTVFSELIRRNKNVTAEHLRSESVKSTVIASQISQWWRTVEKEYRFDETDKFAAYAKYILLNWINKFTFANMIKANHNPAQTVETIDEGVTPTIALSVFADITSKCDFFNIFEAVLYGDVLPSAT